MTELFAVFCLLLAAWFWLDSLRSRELATEICRAACRHHEVQLLDQTVVLHRLSLQRTASGLRLRRLYHFDFSEEGLTRRSGYLVLLGIELLAIRLDTQDQQLDI